MTRCPREAIDGDVWDVIELAGFAKDGHWPVGEGLLKESASFCDAAKFWWAQDAMAKAKLGIK